ncbi:MAG: NAD(P)-binding protein [Phycisphaerales bacterium]|nr:NAD(P)-binding protein [Phycisphaerales bacterium]
MKSRREVLRNGLGIFAAGAFGPTLGTAGAMDVSKAVKNQGKGSVGPQTGTPGGVSLNELKSSRPLAPRSFDPKPRMIDGFPFKSWFEGDDFRDDIPFHSQQNDFPGGQPPEPTEEINVAVIGGGISGMAAARFLQDYNPVIFELHTRFGGNAQGGTINGAEFSLGSAYFITPDPNTMLDDFYRDLGLHDVVRVDSIPAPVEINGEINDDIWTGMGVAKKDIPAYEAYRNLVMRMADDYPDVPFSEQWMIDLDRLSLREHIEQEMGMPVPAALAAAVQAYCYASFAAGWEEISATLGWNFLAAEEFGRWVLPGGNAWMANELWKKLRKLDRKDPAHAPHLRPGRRTVEVRKQDDGRWLVTWIEPDGTYKSLLAKEVVMACAKNIARHIIYGLENDDPDLYIAMRLPRRAYLVANVIVDRPIPLDFYGIFLLENPEEFPMSDGQAANFWRYTDVTNGSFTPGPNANTIPQRPSVLTLFWPLPFDSARFTLILGDPLLDYGQALASKLRGTLDLVGLPESSVIEVRFARWGHAVPVSRVGFLADGLHEILGRPYQESLHFANQDNWGMPAIENAVISAFDASEAIKKRLG